MSEPTVVSCLSFCFWSAANTIIHSKTKSFALMSNGEIHTNTRKDAAGIGCFHISHHMRNNPILDSFIEESSVDRVAYPVDLDSRTHRTLPIGPWYTDSIVVNADTLCWCPCCNTYRVKENADIWDRMFWPKDGVKSWLKLVSMHKSCRFPAVVVSRCDRCRKGGLYDNYESALKQSYSSFGGSDQSRLEKFLEFKLPKKYGKNAVSRDVVKRSARRYIRRNKKHLSKQTKLFFQMMLGASKFKEAMTNGGNHNERNQKVA